MVARDCFADAILGYGCPTTGLERFYQDVLGLRLVHTEPHFWVFELPDGNHVEVFGRQYPGKEHFDTGPVVGFAVTDLTRAVQELRDAGVELVGPRHLLERARVLVRLDEVVAQFD